MSDEKRSNAVGYVAAGGGLVGAGVAADALVDADRRKKGLKGPVRSLRETKRVPRRVLAGSGIKVASTGVKAAGVPLAAYGAWSALRGEKVPKASIRRDVVDRGVRGVTFVDAADQVRRSHVVKRQLTAAENRKLAGHKEAGRTLSLAAGTMGMVALGLRAPEAARAVQRIRRLKRVPGLSRVAAKEPGATKASNTLGIAAIGTGSAGSFNYAAQQKLEREALKKSWVTDRNEQAARVRRLKRDQVADGLLFDAATGTLAGTAATAGLPLVNRGVTQLKASSRFAGNRYVQSLPSVPVVSQPFVPGRLAVPHAAGKVASKVLPNAKVLRVASNPVLWGTIGTGLAVPAVLHARSKKKQSKARFERARDRYRRSVSKGDRSRRVGADAQALGLQAAAGGLALGSVGAFGARWASNPNTPQTMRSLNRRMLVTGTKKDKRRALLANVERAGKWSRDKRGRLAAVGGVLAAGSVAAHTAARWKRDESQALSHRIAVRKNLGDAVMRGAGRVRVLASPKKDYFDVLDRKDRRYFVHRRNLTWVKQPKNTPVQGELPFEKADDRFLRQYRTRISPEAEFGYQRLRHVRNKERAAAAASAVGGAVAGGAALHAGVRGRGKFAALMAIPAVTGAVAAGRSADASTRVNARMDKIKAKAYERERAGVFGRGRRVVEKSDGRDVVGGSALAANGAGLLVAGVSTNRGLDAANRAANRLIDARRRAQLQRFDDLYGVSASGRPVVKPAAGTSRTGKAKAAAARRRMTGQINDVNRRANVYRKLARKATGFGPRVALISGGLVGGSTALWAGGRRLADPVEKKASRQDVDAFAAGAAGGAGLYHGALYATKPIDRRIERALGAESPSSPARVALAEHQRALGIGRRKERGVNQRAWLKYHRSYPKAVDTPIVVRGRKLPVKAWQWKRGLSYLQGGKTQLGITAGVAAASGLGAAAVARAARKEKMSKALPALVKPRLRFRRPSMNRSYIGTSVNGRKFTVRGSVR